MASFFTFPYSPCALFTLIYLLSVCSCSKFNHSKIYNDMTTTVTWYGAPQGFGSDGGACGYGSAVGTVPFRSFVSSANPAIFQNGKGCGECYQVKCNSNRACSGKPIIVTVTDSCPGCEPNHFFDLSGTAFGAMAAPGQANQLRNAGKISALYQRVPCNYPGVKITFKVDPGSNPYYFATNIEYENGDGDLSKVEARSGNGPFLEMQLSSGATWKLNSPGRQLNGPISIRLFTQSGKSITAGGVIPAGWRAGRTYRSTVNFN